MAAAVMLMYVNPPPGREADYARWYDDVHIPDMCTIPGVTSGLRLELAGPGAKQIARDGTLVVAQYLVIYQLEHGDEPRLRAAIAERVPGFRAAGRMFDGTPQLISNTIYRRPSPETPT